MKHTALLWEASKFTKLEGSEIKTVDDVIECLKISATLAGGIELYGVTPKGTDETIICYTGNGKTSKANALFIAKACNYYNKLLIELASLLNVDSYEARKKIIDNVLSQIKD